MDIRQHLLGFPTVSPAIKASMASPSGHPPIFPAPLAVSAARLSVGGTTSMPWRLHYEEYHRQGHSVGSAYFYVVGVLTKDECCWYQCTVKGDREGRDIDAELGQAKSFL